VIDSTKINSYIAGDVYEIWQSSINRATDEILVITPYFNNVLKELIDSKLKSPNFERKNIKILTRFSSELAWGNKEQLSVGIELIEMGVELRQLNNIHAKLLIVDKTELVLGSQNFTNNGREAKEASVSVWYMLDNRNYDNFLTSIDLWWEEATPVKAELLRELLKKLEDLENSLDFLKEHRNNVSKIFDNFHKDCNKSNRTKIIDNEVSMNEEIQGKVELVQFASKSRKIIEVTSDFKLGESLNRLTFYPMLIKPINRLVYARVAGTRISFVIDRINRKNIPLKIGGLSYFPQVSFSEDDFNININLVKECDTRTNLSFKFKFDGEFLTAENSSAQNSLERDLENIVFQSFACQRPFLKTCKAPGDFFPFHLSFYQNLKITVQTTTNNSKILVCNY
jgi:PLD-like domain